MSIPQFSLAWSGSSLAWSSAVTSQNFLMLGLAASHDLFALYVGTAMSSPISESWVVLGMYTLAVLSGDSVCWHQLWLQLPALGFSLSSCPGLIICSPPQRRKFYTKLPKPPTLNMKPASLFVTPSQTYILYEEQQRQLGFFSLEKKRIGRGGSYPCV